MFCQSQYCHQTPVQQREPFVKDLLKDHQSINNFLKNFLSETFQFAFKVTMFGLPFQNHYLSIAIQYTSLPMHLLIQWPEKDKIMI